MTELLALHSVLIPSSYLAKFSLQQFLSYHWREEINERNLEDWHLRLPTDNSVLVQLLRQKAFALKIGLYSLEIIFFSTPGFWPAEKTCEDRERRRALAASEKTEPGLKMNAL